ncbi:MAG: amino acid ABC transporter permease [Steroidobacteraceae bacterium]
MAQFDFSLLLSGQYHDWLIAGLLMSLQLTASCLLLALPLGIGVALLRLSPWRALRGLGWLYVESIRNVPLLPQLLFWYFAAPELLPAAWKEWLYQQNVEMIAATVGLTLYTAAYMAEDVRSGVRAVPQGQLEAARSLGFGFLPAMRLVVLPQALRVTVPPLISQTLNLWMNTSVTTVIGAGELMYQAARVESNSFRSAEAFAFATACYLAVSLAISALGSWYQRHYPVRAA